LKPKKTRRSVNYEEKETSGQSNLTQGRTAAADGSIVFAK